MRGIIISGGTPPSKKLLERVIDKNSIIIFSDSGANVGFKYGLDCKAIVGDLDSISQEAKDYYTKKHCKFITFNKEKDFTDTELAIVELIKYEVDSIILLGCIGTRMDHTLANMGLLVNYASKGYNIKIMDEHNEIMVLLRSTIIHAEEHKVFSLQSFRDKVSNLSIIGAKYPLRNYDLYSGDPLTVSNEFLDRDVEIIFNEGTLLLIYPYD